MIELIIFIVLVVQTNDFTPSSLCSSSRPIRLLQRLSSHADKSMHDCLTNRFERCKKTYKDGPLFAECVTNNFFLCLYGHQNEADAKSLKLVILLENA
jgi:hypothetical protein